MNTHLTNQPASSHSRRSGQSWFTFLPSIKKDADGVRILLPTVPILLGLLVAIIIVGQFAWQQYAARSALPNAQERNILAELGQVMVLPDEAAQFSLVTEVELLNQSFFANAANGDYAIVFPQSGKVLLYRPTTQKIINFATIDLPPSEPTVFTLD